MNGTSVRYTTVGALNPADGAIIEAATVHGIQKLTIECDELTEFGRVWHAHSKFHYHQLLEDTLAVESSGLKLSHQPKHKGENMFNDTIVHRPAPLAELGKIFEWKDVWRCQCGAEHKFEAYAAAQWNYELTHTCTACGSSRTFLGGEVIECNA